MNSLVKCFRSVSQDNWMMNSGNWNKCFIFNDCLIYCTIQYFVEGGASKAMGYIAMNVFEEEFDLAKEICFFFLEDHTCLKTNFVGFICNNRAPRVSLD